MTLEGGGRWSTWQADNVVGLVMQNPHAYRA
jgi:hypothetical protein